MKGSRCAMSPRSSTSRRSMSGSSFTTAARQHEYVEARAALGPLMGDTVGFIRERVEHHQEYRTTGAVRVLSEAANTACERNPLHARNLADAAVAIAEQLSSDDCPRDTVHTL